MQGLIEVSIAFSIVAVLIAPVPAGIINGRSAELLLQCFLQPFLYELLDLVAAVLVFSRCTMYRCKWCHSFCLQQPIALQQPVENGALILRLGEQRFQRPVLFGFLKMLIKGNTAIIASRLLYADGKKQISFKDTLVQCGMSESTFYRRLREYRLKNKHS